MTVNTNGNSFKGSTPPRTVRQMFMDYVRKSMEAYRKANEIQETYSSLASQYGGENGAIIACSEDHDWRTAVGDQQFNERLANMHANIAHLNVMENIWLEQQNTNQLLALLIQALTTEEGNKGAAAQAAHNYLGALARSRQKNSR